MLSINVDSETQEKVTEKEENLVSGEEKKEKNKNKTQQFPKLV